MKQGYIPVSDSMLGNNTVYGHLQLRKGKSSACNDSGKWKILALHHDLILRRLLNESTKGLIVLLGEANIWHVSIELVLGI